MSRSGGAVTFRRHATAASLLLAIAVAANAADPKRDALWAALDLASGRADAKLKGVLETAGAKPLPPAPEQDRKEWAKLAGSYDSDGGARLTVAVKEAGLVINGRVVKPAGPDTFVPL